MENPEKSFNVVCRLCLRYEESNKNTSLVDFNRINGLSVCGEFVTKLISLDIDLNDKLPKNICFDCENELKRIECFKSMCKTNYERLKSFVQDQSKKRFDEVNNMATAIQFTKYFPDRFQEFYSKMTLEGMPLRHVKLENSTNDVKPRNMNYKSTQSCKGETVVPKVEVEIECSHVVVPKLEIEIEEIDTNNSSELKTSIEDESQSQTKTMEGLRLLLDQLDTLPKLKQNFTCNICNRKLSNKSNYKMHMQTHKKSNICDQCGKGFSKMIYMHKHQITHHGVPSSFECDTCSFRATSQLELIEHIRLHTGERPFTCEKCGLTFRRRYIYRRHLKCHDEKKVQCPKCPMKFYLLSEMKAHMNNIHERICLYLCHVCNTSYTKTVSVRKHLLSEHGIARENQGKIMRVTKNTHASLFRESKA